MVFEKVRKILCEQFELEEDRVTMESNLIGDLGADSLDVIDLAMSIEDEFDIEVPDDEIEKIKTVGDIVRFVEDH
jgi:acyl carrier protein